MKILQILETANMVYISGISAALQTIGTLTLVLFSFNGVKISDISSINGEPASHVTIVRGWLNAARIGSILLLFGIFASGILAIVSFADRS